MNDSGASAQTSLVDRLSCLVAAGGGLGYLPKAPGTFGSLLGPLLFGLLDWDKGAIQDPRWCFMGFIGVMFFLVGVWLSERAIRVSGIKDPQFVVCDEFFAFAWVYLLVPVHWDTAVVGFVYFRIFDIWKPGPVGWAERLPGGWGVMADDAVAGLLAGGCLWGTAPFLPALWGFVE